MLTISPSTAPPAGRGRPGRAVQVVALDVVFSLDSVITAVGMVPPDRIWVMVTAVIASVVVMLVFAARIGAFVLRHPSVKILALAFLVLVGVLLVAYGLGEKIPKGYVYFSMTFKLAVELLNLRFRRRRKQPSGARSRRRAPRGRWSVPALMCYGSGAWRTSRASR